MGRANSSGTAAETGRVRRTRGRSESNETSSEPRQSTSRLTVASAVAWVILSVGTGIAYLLPLSQHVTDIVSNVTFVIAGAIIMVTLGRAIMLSLIHI